jgi:hypothetical protein
MGVAYVPIGKVGKKLPRPEFGRVSAGPNQTLAYPTRTTTLAGSASDDGQPAGGALSFNWSVVSGPGTVTFTGPSTALAGVSFGYPGTYVLRLTVSDGELSSSSDVAVVVEAAPVIRQVQVLPVAVPPNGKIEATVSR